MYGQCILSKGAPVNNKSLAKDMRPMLKDYPRPSEVEEYAKLKGHEVCWLPPYHPEFNPIEKMWGVAKQHIRDTYNINQDTKDNFKKRIKEGFDKCTPKVWAGACRKCNNARTSSVTAQWLAGVKLPTSFIITLDDEDDNDNDEEVMVAKGVVPVEEVGPSIDQPSLHYHRHRHHHYHPITKFHHQQITSLCVVIMMVRSALNHSVLCYYMLMTT
jgi:hypothetical protein